MHTFLDETYREVQRLIEHTVHLFRRQYGGNYDELRSDAHLGFMRAYKSYRPEKASFATWTRLKAWKQMLESHRTRKRRAAICDWDESVDIEKVEWKPFTIELLLVDLSPEARSIVQLILSRGQQHHAPKRLWARLKLLLRSKGWSAGKIRRVVNEIRNALS